MPGIAEQVPGAADRVARLEDRERLAGEFIRSWLAAPMPDRPAPTISTSTCSAGRSGGASPLAAVGRRVGHVGVGTWARHPPVLNYVHGGDYQHSVD